MLNSLTTLFKQLLEGSDVNKQDQNPHLAMACLLAEVSGADHDITAEEEQAKKDLLAKLTGLETEQAAGLIIEANERIKQSASIYEFTSQLRELSQQARFDVIKALWEVAHADGDIDPLEDAVIRKAAELLYVEHSEFIRAKLMVVDHKQ
ncbi:TerB family tellurite resistance protein [Vibrio palustris]|uniref:Tellurite resistance protein TerB n=1 Tax=Vibrio palustris TaxID=1918946 RepID=A0A1R4B2E1_9VIBR|nr:TerB family tellurite resistance protein [Vibrio palustris]SJL83066.1 Tellurite resistance protein TerB [Vibrio palustris]